MILGCQFARLTERRDLDSVQRMSQRPLNSSGGDAPIVGIRLTHDQNQRLREIAGRRGVTVSALLRQLIAALDRLDIPELEGSATGPPGSG